MIRVRITRARGSTPREEGAEMMVGPEAVTGTIGGGQLEYLAIDRAREVDPELPVVAYLLEHNHASRRVVDKLGLTLQHRGPDAGNPDPAAVRLVYADRELTADERAAIMQAQRPRAPRP